MFGTEGKKKSWGWEKKNLLNAVHGSSGRDLWNFSFLFGQDAAAVCVGWTLPVPD